MRCNFHDANRPQQICPSVLTCTCTCVMTVNMLIAVRSSEHLFLPGNYSCENSQLCPVQMLIALWSRTLYVHMIKISRFFLETIRLLKYRLFKKNYDFFLHKILPLDCKTIFSLHLILYGNYRVLNIYCAFSKNFKTLQPLPRQYWAVIGRSEKGQPIGVTVLSDLLHGWVGLQHGGDGLQWIGKKTQFPMNTLRIKCLCIINEN